MAAKAQQGTECAFTPPQRVSENKPRVKAPYGKGPGAARVALAGYANNKALAVWADKRDFREGYDIYAASYPAGKQRLFGANQKVQDSFGGVAHQWHASAAGNSAGHLVVVWDDNRDGDANVMFSWREQNEWSDDEALPGADGKGLQNNPSVVMDSMGNLHVAWVERASMNGPTSLRYVFGRHSKLP
jgi:hypothetical protein